MDCPYHTPPGPGGPSLYRKKRSVMERSVFNDVPITIKNIRCGMYPWPIGNFDYVMDDALDIAMNYLLLTGQAVPFKEAQATAARAIVAAWQRQGTHKIKPANPPIKAIWETLPNS